MSSLPPIVEVSVLIIIAGLPLAFVGLMFLHAARAPQWAWAMVGRTQIVWLVALIFGAAVIPLGLPVAAYYVWKIRPALDAVERGDLSAVRLNDDPEAGQP